MYSPATTNTTVFVQKKPKLPNIWTGMLDLVLLLGNIVVGKFQSVFCLLTLALCNNGPLWRLLYVTEVFSETYNVCRNT
jgi:hypothetical protein